MDTTSKLLLVVLGRPESADSDGPYPMKGHSRRVVAPGAKATGQHRREPAAAPAAKASDRRVAQSGRVALDRHRWP